MAQTITYSQIEEMLYFSLKESIEFAKISNKDYGISKGGVQDKLMEKYSISKLLAASVHRPVFWYFSIESKLIPCNGNGMWSIDESAKNLNDKDLKTAAVYLMSKHKDYLKSNFELEGYKVQ